jgi:hypothetical protein
MYCNKATIIATGMKNKSLVDVTANKPIKIAVIVVVLAIVIAVSAYAAFSRDDDEETTGLEVIDIKVTEPKPTILNDRTITIDYGESVTFNLTVKNNGRNITAGDGYYVGIGVITNEGGKYWQLPPDQFIGVDLGPGGTSKHTFTARNREERPFKGECDIQGYIKSVATDEILARSDVVTVEIMYPATHS